MATTKATTTTTAAAAAARLPRLVAFDLDGTIWTPDMYMLWGGGSPFRTVSNGELRDRSGQPVRLLGISGEILDEIAVEPGWSETTVAWVSCTDEPSWADECARKFRTPSGVPLADRVREEIIYKADKRTHFRDLRERTGIDFADMVFFDNERGNIRSVSKLGVLSVHCPNGMTREVWKDGIDEWQRRQNQLEQQLEQQQDM
mmetsp:Transcript_22660/g.53743  ORF Transcript_22660/g.53743 Transcript_22660/m.53743 type:complete len:202 (-) Transcript_22660:97-702(-)